MEEELQPVSWVPRLCFQTQDDSIEVPCLGLGRAGPRSSPGAQARTRVTSFGTSGGSVFHTFSIAAQFSSK